MCAVKEYVIRAGQWFLCPDGNWDQKKRYARRFLTLAEAVRELRKHEGAKLQEVQS